MDLVGGLAQVAKSEDNCYFLCSVQLLCLLLYRCESNPLVEIENNILGNPGTSDGTYICLRMHSRLVQFNACVRLFCSHHDRYR